VSVSVNVNVKGFKTMFRELEKLPKDMQRNATRAALRAGTKEFQAALERNAPVRQGDFRPLYIGRKANKRPRFPGHLKRHIQLKKVRPKNLGKLYEAYWTAPKRDAFYGLILALGGRYGRWSLPATPWIERAYEAMDQRVLRTFEDKIARYISRWAKKSNAKTKAGK